MWLRGSFINRVNFVAFLYGITRPYKYPILVCLSHFWWLQKTNHIQTDFAVFLGSFFQSMEIIIVSHRDDWPKVVHSN